MSKNFSIFNPKNCSKISDGNIIWDIHPESDLAFTPSFIPDPGVKKAPEPKSRIRNTENINKKVFCRLQKSATGQVTETSSKFFTKENLVGSGSETCDGTARPPLMQPVTPEQACEVSPGSEDKASNPGSEDKASLTSLDSSLSEASSSASAQDKKKKSKKSKV